MPGPTPTAPQTFLEVLSSCDNYRLRAPYTTNDPVVPFLLSPARDAPAVGLLRAPVVHQLLAEAAAAREAGAEPAWAFGPPSEDGRAAEIGRAHV